MAGGRNSDAQKRFCIAIHHVLKPASACTVADSVAPQLPGPGLSVTSLTICIMQYIQKSALPPLSPTAIARRSRPI